MTETSYLNEAFNVDTSALLKLKDNTAKQIEYNARLIAKKLSDRQLLEEIYIMLYKEKHKL